MAPDQAADEEERGESVDEAAGTDVVAARSEEPQKCAGEDVQEEPNPAGNFLIEVKKEDVEREKGGRVVPEVVEIGMEERVGEDALPPIEVARVVAESPETERINVVCPVDAPDQDEEEKGCPKTPVNAGGSNC